MWGEKMKIPYEHIDIEMRRLIYELNKLDCLYTIGCCIGHGVDLESDIILKVTNEELWNVIMLKLLRLNNKLKESNINIFKWHRLSLEDQLITDWLIKIQVHPKNKENVENETNRIQRIKKEAINNIINEIN